jgi:uncharacterized membrane protein
MEASHIHVLINHVPLLGTLFGIILFISGLIFKNKSFEKAGLLTFIVVGLATIATYFSGGMAVGAIKKIAGTSRDAIHEHREMAETALYLMLGLMLASLTVMVVQWRSKNRKTGTMKGIVLVLALITFVFMSLVNNLGGKVRRPELRDEVTKNEKNLKEDEGKKN